MNAAGREPAAVPLPPFKVVIPARYGSTRLRGKPLLQIGDRPLIAHVIARAQESAAEEVIVATDDARIAETSLAFGAEALLTRTDHPSGADRLAEVMTRRGWEDETLIVNLQGDEPCLPAALIDQVAGDLAARAEVGMATLAFPIEEAGALFDPHVVKVVTDREGYAQYFSRAPIPWNRDEFCSGGRNLPAGVPFLRHIGLYAYRAAFLRRFLSWEPTPLERSESLEQLRVLWHGERISVALARQRPGPGVDTAEDLERVRALLRAFPAVGAPTCKS